MRFSAGSSAHSSPRSAMAPHQPRASSFRRRRPRCGATWRPAELRQGRAGPTWRGGREEPRGARRERPVREQRARLGGSRGCGGGRRPVSVRPVPGLGVRHRARQLLGPSRARRGWARRRRGSLVGFTALGALRKPGREKLLGTAGGIGSQRQHTRRACTSTLVLVFLPYIKVVVRAQVQRCRD